MGRFWEEARDWTEEMQQGFKKGRPANRRGQRFGKLTVVSMVRKRGRFRQALVRAVCECGSLRTYMLHNLTSGGTVSCGCKKSDQCREMRKPIRHGHAVGQHTRTYSSFAAARNRCNNPNGKDWATYGGAGVKFLFPDFESFFAELGERPPGETLDRYPNPAGNYEFGNVRWASATQQAMNRRHRLDTSVLEEK